MATSGIALGSVGHTASLGGTAGNSVAPASHSAKLLGNIGNAATVNGTVAAPAGMHSTNLLGIVGNSASLPGIVTGSASTAHKANLLGNVGHSSLINGSIADSRHVARAIGNVGHRRTLPGTVAGTAATSHSKSLLGNVGHKATLAASVDDTGGHSAALVGNVGHSTTLQSAVFTFATLLGNVGHRRRVLQFVGHTAQLAGTVYDPITLVPATLTFTHRDSRAQTIQISQGTAARNYTAVSSNTGIATVALSGAAVIVTPVSPGPATITITDDLGTTATASITVGADAGLITFDVPSLALAIGGAQTIQVSRPNDTDPFTLTSIPAGFVQIDGTGSAPNASYTIEPLTVGSGQLVVTAGDGSTATLQIDVYGALTATVTSRKNARTLTVVATESGYRGPLTASFVGANTATLAPTQASGPNATFAISDTIPGELFLLQIHDAFGQLAELTLQSRNVSLGAIAVTFVDETGLNPVAPGTRYEVYFTGDPIDPDSLVDEGYVGVDGAASITFDESTSYTILFFGNQAPRQTQQYFTGPIGTTAAVITVSGYHSPNHSQLGYVESAKALLTRGWIGEQYLQRGAPGTTGTAYNVLYSVAAPLNLLDRRQQTTSVATRLQTCIGYQVDAFATDYLGNTLRREPGESDMLYKARIVEALNGQTVIYKAVSKAANAAWRTLGNAGTIQVSDGIASWDESIVGDPDPITKQPPQLRFYDNTGNPIMNALGLTEPSSIILLPSVVTSNEAFYEDFAFLGIDTYLLAIGQPQIVENPPALVVKAVESKRAFGTKPYYVQIQN